MNIYQQTISKPIDFSGIGLHSGKKVEISLIPEKPNFGIKFIFKDKKIKASWRNAKISQLCTTLAKEKLCVSTIEHLMSALSGLGITNLAIKTSSEEMPILDGSAKDYVDKILEAGVVKQEKKRKILNIKKKISFSQKNKFIEIYPNKKNSLIIDFTIDYKDEFIKKQQFVYEHSIQNYKDIYLARTFCLHKDLEKIFSMGLGKGGTLDNAIVVSGKKILNQGGLRYYNEFVKHKILDCIGDLYLSEYLIYGHIKTFGSGHELNLILLNEIFKNNDNFEIL